MLCPHCRRRVRRGAGYCESCGAPASGSGGSFELVLDDRTRVPVLGDMTIGRAPGSTLQLTDPSVSRSHARVSLGGPGDAPLLEDAGSTYGTWVDGTRLDSPRALRDGARIRLGNQEILVERRRSEEEAGRTIVVPPGASLVVPAAGGPAELAPAATGFGPRPRLRSGYALKRLEAAEGPKRWVLRDLESGKSVRLADADGQLLELLDGRRSLADLVGEAERLSGPAGPAQLARLLADLGERGLLAGSGAQRAGEEEQPAGRLERLLRPHEQVWPRAGEIFERVYRGGGWLLFTRPALAAVALIAVFGIGVFGFLVLRRYGTPFVVASKVGIGGLVFLVGRFAIAAIHETAHGLTMASFGRRVQKAGFKLLLVFPYVYVDTSEMWFEPRRRRIAVSGAGPVSDFTLGGIFSLCCLALPPGSVRDILFQLAFAAYVGGLFNMNPFLERDGYQVLVDVLREPGLRRRALAQLRRRLSGGGPSADSPVLTRYALFVLGWWVVAGAFAVGMSLHYAPVLEALVPTPVAWILLAAVWVLLFAPLLLIVVPALRLRFSHGTT